MIEQSLERIATALENLLKIQMGGTVRFATAADAARAVGTPDVVQPAATATAPKGKGRPPGSPNKPKAPEAAPTTAVEAEEASDVPPVTAAQEAVTSTIKAGHRDEVLATLTKYAAKNASGVKEVDRAAFIAELDAIKAGADADADPAG